MDTNLKINPILVLRALQALLAIITLGLFGHVAAWYNSNPVSPSSDPEIPSSAPVPNEIIYAVFVTVLTLLITLPYALLTPRYFPTLAHRFAILTLEFLTMTLWFASWIAVASFLGRLAVCRGHVCGAAKAGVALAALEWLSWVVTTVFALRFCLARNSVGGPASGDVAKGNRNHSGDRVEDEEEEKKWMGKLRGWGVGSFILKDEERGSGIQGPKF